MLYINTQLTLRQVAHMTVRSYDMVVSPKELIDGLCLCR